MYPRLLCALFALRFFKVRNLWFKDGCRFGSRQSGRARYGCPLKHARGICEKGLHIRQDSLEREVLEGLQREVLSEDVAQYALAQFKQQLQERLEGARSQLAVLRTERERLKEEIGNLAGVIATSRHSPALLAELEKRERRLDEISEELLASDGAWIDARLREIDEFVLSRLKDLSGLLAGEIPRAKAELAKHCTDITLTPEGKSYRLSGEWDLLGVRSDGAGGTARTGNKSLRPECVRQL